MNDRAGTSGPTVSTTVLAGLCSVTLRQLTWRSVVDIAVASGLEVVEWGGDVHVPHGDLRRAAAVRVACDTAGIALMSYGSYIFAGVTEADGVAEALDTAAALGVGTVRVWAAPGVRPTASQADRERVVDGLRGVVTAAADRSLTVAVEFHPGTLTETAASTNALIDAVPGAFSYWQPLPGQDPDRAVDEFRAVADRCAHLHVFWWATSGRRLPLAEGRHPWTTILAESVRSGRWDGSRVAYLEFVEGDDPAIVTRDAATLRAFLDGIPSTP